MLAGKHCERGEQSSKLCNGLFKISDTWEKVESVSVEPEEAKNHVAEFQIMCDEYPSVSMQQNVEADSGRR